MTGHHSPMESHLNDALDENIAFLLDECHMQPDEAAARLGIKTAALIQRRRRAESDSPEVTDHRGGARAAEVSEMRRSHPARSVAPPQGKVG